MRERENDEQNKAFASDAQRVHEQDRFMNEIHEWHAPFVNHIVFLGHGPGLFIPLMQTSSNSVPMTAAKVSDDDKAFFERIQALLADAAKPLLTREQVGRYYCLVTGLDAVDDWDFIDAYCLPYMNTERNDLCCYK